MSDIFNLLFFPFFFFSFSQNVHLRRLSLMCVLPDRYRPALRLSPGSRGRYQPTPGFRASPLNVLRRRIADPPKTAYRGSANPHKMACKGSANPHKMASKGSAAPSKSAPKGSAGSLKTAASNDDSSSRRSPTKMRVEGVLVDVEGFSHPSRSAPSSRPRVPPNLTVWFSFEKRKKKYIKKQFCAYC